MSVPPLTRILYVEDEPDIQAVARLALETVGGFTLEVCDSGNEALAKATNFDPQLILMDVMMPGMDGPTVLHELRKLNGLANTPAIFMTAKVHPEEIEQLKDAGAIEVIAKPFDPMTLSDSIRGIWASHQG